MMSDGRRKVCVVTGSRAEYGLLFWLMRELVEAPDVQLQLVVSAMHLHPAFGETVKLIRADGFAIDAEVPCLQSGDDPRAMAGAMAEALGGFAEKLSGLAPDILVVLGDRFEILAAASAATILRIPIAHIHGGEVTEGALDDAFRHAVTKMSHLHFAATSTYARRIEQLGEASERIHVVGALGLENMVRMKRPTRQELGRELKLDLAGGYFLMTWHPETLGLGDPVAELNEILRALTQFPDKKVIVTKANADFGGRAINNRLDELAAADPQNVRVAYSLTQATYLAALENADAVIGNSSSGLIEAPAVNVPTINIGTRQGGRLRARSIIDCAARADAIVAAISKSQAPAFRAALAEDAPPYGRPGKVAEKIVAVLRQTDLSTLLRKGFHDLPRREPA
jgi:UDP-hydrolysing UDP-N-acetyl-D-glucosamine 2-epimerase